MIRTCATFTPKRSEINARFAADARDRTQLPTAIPGSLGQRAVLEVIYPCPMPLQGAAIAGDVTVGDAPDGIYQIASVSKQFVAAAVLTLVDQKRLDLHAPVDRWLLDAHPQWHTVTLHQLLTHTAGFPHWDFATPAIDSYSPLSCDERVRLLARTALAAGPGGPWAYTSPSYILIGAIFERAAGMSFADFATERFVRPLGLTDTHVGYRPDNAAPGRVNGAPAREIDAEQMTGTGAAPATWSRCSPPCTAATCYPAPMLQLLHTPHTPAEGQSYGYGVYVGQRAGEPAFWHMGDLPGHMSFSAWLPQRGVSVVVLSNEENTDAKAVADQLIADCH